MLYRTFTNRYEIKYLATAAQADNLKNEISKTFIRDSYTNNQTGYFNYSVYFDSNDYFFYREKTEGLNERLKPRLRCHLQNPNEIPTNWKLELKGRINRTVQKRRTILEDSEIHKLLNGLDLINDNGELAIKEFNYLRLKHAIIPAVSIIYFREPYNSNFFPNVRITFDYDIKSSLGFSFPDKNSNIVDPSKILIELKYTDSIPNSILEIFRRVGLYQTTFSKFTFGLESAFEKIRPAIER